MVAGVYPINLQVVDPHNATTNATVTITVNKETAETSYTGDMGVVTAGPTVTTATVRLGASHAGRRWRTGRYHTRAVTFELFKSNNLSNTPDITIERAG